MANKSWAKFDVAATSRSWETAINWATGVKPANTDDVAVANTLSDIDSGLDQQTITLTALRLPQTFEGTLGTGRPADSTLSVTGITRVGTTATVTTASNHNFVTGDVVEIIGATQTAYNGTFTVTVTGATTFTYTVTGSPATPATGTIVAIEASELTIGATDVIVGEPGGDPAIPSQGSPRIRLNTVAIACNLLILNTRAGSKDPGREPVTWRGTSSTNKIYVRSGTLGIGTWRAYDSAATNLLHVAGPGALVNTGVAVTYGTVRVGDRGVANVNVNSSSSAAMDVYDGGVLNLGGVGSIATLNVGTAGRANVSLRANSGATIAQVNFYEGSILDVSASPEGLTVTAAAAYGRYRVIEAFPGQIIWTGGRPTVLSSSVNQSAFIQ